MRSVKLVNDTLDSLGRWYVAVPPFLILGFLLGVFLIAGAGQARLQKAAERLQESALRSRAVDELQDSLARAVGAQRGFLLTNDSTYLAAYNKAVADVEPQLERLRTAYGELGFAQVELRDLQLLVGKRLADLAMIRTIQQTHGTATAIDLVKSRVGSDTGQEIGAILDRLRQRETDERNAADAYWRNSLTLSHWITFAGALFSLLALGIAARLIYGDIRRRSLLTDELRNQKLKIEQEVEQRTQELVELSTHLQNLAEREKASLARELHDELGGLLVGARMDISWAEQHLAKNDPDMKQRLSRVQQNLAAGVDLKRRIIEELRPTLLDNVGLSAALRWQLKETCGAAGLKCIESYPDAEPRFKSEASIALFRIAQEAFTNILKHAQAKTVDVSLDVDEQVLLLRIADDGKGIPTVRFNAIASHGLACMRHRVRALGGKFEVRSPSTGGTILLVQIPAENAVLSYDEAEST
jgi:signal transduction histidine kinase